MMRMIIAFGAAALVAGCQTTPPEPPAPVLPTIDPSSPLAAPTYLAMASSGDLFEIQSGQLALQMSQNAGVRSFAQMLVTDHTRMSQQMMAAAQAAGLNPPPPALLPHHQTMLDQLRMAGPNFDLAFRDAQIAAHQEALTLHQNYASGGDHPALRPVAAAAVPVIQGHLNHAQMLSVAPPPAPVVPEPVRPGERG